MPRTKALSIYNKLAKAAEVYNEKFKEDPDNFLQFNEEHLKEIKKDNQLKVKDAAISTLTKILKEVEELGSEIELKKKQALFPLLNSNDDSNKSRGEQQITNANLIFQGHFLSGNEEYLLNEINQAIESGRKDYASALINQVRSYPASTDAQINIKNKVNDIAVNYFAKIGISELDEAKHLNLHNSELTAIASKLVEKGNDNIYLPPYKSEDYNNSIVLEQIRMETGIDAEASHNF